MSPKNRAIQLCRSLAIEHDIDLSKKYWDIGSVLLKCDSRSEYKKHYNRETAKVKILNIIEGFNIRKDLEV